MAWITKTTQQPGWTAGARSIASMSGDGTFSFTVGQSLGIVAGLNDSDLSAGYREIHHGFFIQDRQARVIESGLELASWTTFTSDQLFEITRIGGVVQYFINGTLIYTSTTPSSNEVFIDCSLYADGDTIIDVSLTELNDPRMNPDIQLLPLLGFGTDVDGVGRALLEPLTVSIHAESNSDEVVYLEPLAAIGSDGSNFGFLRLSPLALTQSELAPEIDYGLLSLSPLTVSAWIDEPGIGDASISPLLGFGTDTDGVGRVLLSPLACEIWTVIDNTFFLRLPFFKGYTYTERLGLHETSYGVTTSHLHRVSYEGTSTVVALHQTSYAQAAQSLHVSSWSSSLTNTAQSLHDSIYATISISPSLGLHQSSWASAGLLNTVAGLHEVAWGSAALVSVAALHQTDWASAGGVSSTASLHESSWESVGSLNSVVSLHKSVWGVSIFTTTNHLHEASWASVGELNQVQSLHQTSWASVGTTNTVFNLHRVDWGLPSAVVFSLHETSWSVSSVVSGLHQSSWKSVIEAQNLHDVLYETVDATTALSLHDCIYRSNLDAPVILTGLIYARI